MGSSLDSAIGTAPREKLTMCVAFCGVGFNGRPSALSLVSSAFEENGEMLLAEMSGFMDRFDDMSTMYMYDGSSLCCCGVLLATKANQKRKFGWRLTARIFPQRGTLRSEFFCFLLTFLSRDRMFHSKKNNKKTRIGSVSYRNVPLRGKCSGTDFHVNI